MAGGVNPAPVASKSLNTPDLTNSDGGRDFDSNPTPSKYLDDNLHSRTQALQHPHACMVVAIACMRAVLKNPAIGKSEWPALQIRSLTSAPYAACNRSPNPSRNCNAPLMSNAYSQCVASARLRQARNSLPLNFSKSVSGGGSNSGLAANVDRIAPFRNHKFLSASSRGTSTWFGPAPSARNTAGSLPAAAGTSRRRSVPRRPGPPRAPCPAA